MTPIEKVATYFKEVAGIESYYVGGCVRDEILGLPVEDIDICLVGAPDSVYVNGIFDLMEQFGIITATSGLIDNGQGFPVWAVNVKGIEIHYALARKERSTGAEHTAFDVDIKHITIEQDLYRRDLTINAIAKNVLTGEIVDPYDGIFDLKCKIANPVSEAFAEDPLRVLRAARFIARFGLNYTHDLYLACLKLRPGNIPLERVGMELKKTMEQAKTPSKFFEFLEDVCWLSYYFPELSALAGVQQDPHHHPEGDAFRHTMHCIDAAQHPDLRIVMLCHDLGKATTTTYNETKGKWQALGHEEEGAKLTKQFLKRIKYTDHKSINQIAALVELHMIRAQFVGNRFRTIDKVVRKALRKLLHHELTYQALVDVVRADLAGRPPKPVPEGDLIHESYALLLTMNDAMTPIVTGNTLMGIGIEPGPMMGKIIDHALELQDRGTLTKDNWREVLHGAGYQIPLTS